MGPFDLFVVLGSLLNYQCQKAKKVALFIPRLVGIQQIKGPFSQVSLEEDSGVGDSILKDVLDLGLKL